MSRTLLIVGAAITAGDNGHFRKLLRACFTGLILLSDFASSSGIQYCICWRCCRQVFGTPENKMHENLFQILGVAGFIVYILSYLFLQLGRVDGRGVIYPLLNFAAASLVLLSLLDQFNLASALIQTSWIIISLFGMTRGMIRANPPVRTEIRSFSR